MKGGATRHLSIILVALATTTSVLAEEMKFGYTLGGAQNICFLQNIAENIQGK